MTSGKAGEVAGPDPIYGDMESENSNGRRLRGRPRKEDRRGPLRVRAAAVGLRIRIVLDGFILGSLGEPYERFNTIEALVARLEEVELRQRHPG